jgi:hypothetical protein
MLEAAEEEQSLLHPVSLSGGHIELKKAVLKEPRPIQDPIPL